MRPSANVLRKARLVWSKDSLNAGSEEASPISSTCSVRGKYSLKLKSEHDMPKDYLPSLVVEFDSRSKPLML